MKFVMGDATSTGLVIAAAVIMVGVGGYLAFVPPPKAGPQIAKAVQQEAKLKKSAASLASEYDKVRSAPGVHLFTTSIENTVPQVLKRLTDRAKQSRVSLSGFRPQKEQPNGDIQILPFFMTVQGSIGGITQFLEGLEANEQKLAITMIQIAAPESANTDVTASINVVAYLKPEDPVSSDVKSGKVVSKPGKKDDKVAELGGHSATSKRLSETVTGSHSGSSEPVRGTMDSNAPGAAKTANKGGKNG